MNIVLIGYRAAGKTTVGKRLSASLQKVFIDTDDVIEKRLGAKISEIVETYGWDYFRTIEKEVILDLSKQDNLILAPGGGAVLEQENVRALRRNGLLIWLKAGPQVLLERISKDPRSLTGRPSLTGKGTLKELKETLAARETLYRRASEIQLNTSFLGVEDVVMNILAILRQKVGRA